jgi:cephalosporin-C deacetylase-like acetyl esterase
LKIRPDRDGRTIVVTGCRQGGQQAFVTSGLHPDVTAALALVPAGADFNGPVVGRAAGFPSWYNRIEGRDAVAVRATAPYFDIVNFARNITCPVLVGAGLEDVVCPPS